MLVSRTVSQQHSPEKIWGERVKIHARTHACDYPQRTQTHQCSSPYTLDDALCLKLYRKILPLIQEQFSINLRQLLTATSTTPAAAGAEPPLVAMCVFHLPTPRYGKTVPAGLPQLLAIRIDRKRLK